MISLPLAPAVLSKPGEDGPARPAAENHQVQKRIAPHGSPHYEIGSPLFEEARVDVGGGRTFTVRAPGASASNLYIQSATLDGRPHERPWIAHADAARGATLELRMGPRPNRSWGARPEDAPPSLSTAR